MNDFDVCITDKNGVSLFRTCFDKYVSAKESISSEFLDSNSSELDQILKESENMFFFLVEKGNKMNVNFHRIIEKPDIVGSTCFDIASWCSLRIAKFILEETNIKINSIRQDMVTPSFKFKEIAESMMSKEPVNFLN